LTTPGTPSWWVVLSRPGVRATLGLAGGVALVGAFAWRLDVHPRLVLEHARGISPWVVAGCVGSGFVVLALQALRWHLVMAPLLGLRYVQACRALLVGVMFNAFLPARGGDLLRVQYLGRLTGKSRATILGTEFVDRWLDWWGWFPVLFVLAAVTDLPRWVFTAVALFGGALFVSAAVMLAAARRGYTPRADSRLAHAYRSFRVGVDAFASRRTLIIALAVAPLPWLWEAGMIAVAGRAFHVHLSYATAFSVMVGFNAATIVPSPGGVGSLEAGGTAALAILGVDHSAALAFMLVYHATQLVPAVVAGLLILVAERLPVAAVRPAVPPPNLSGES
jgi:glycosyltransferase 2 family protein